MKLSFLSFLVLGASLCAAGCDGGSGGSGGSGGGTTTASGGSGGATGGTGGATGGTGGATVTSHLQDYGTCSDTGTPLTYETIYDESNGALFWLDSAVSWNNAGGPMVHEEVITDQAAYQVFQDNGLPAVDFTTSEVLLVAARNPAAGGGGPYPHDYSLAMVDGAPNLTFNWSWGPVWNGSACITYNLELWALVAVKIPIPDKAPTFCAHVDSGC
ncbi:MAG: hypothetical protein U0441_31785 [Polyangiaceae bacterium]